MSVSIDGIHPARRIGKINLKSSKRSRLRCVIASTNCCPPLEKIGPSPLLCSALQARMNVASKSRVGTMGSVQSTRKNRAAFDNQRDCQTVRPPNYENREEMLCINRMRRQFSEAKLRFLN